MGGAETSLEQLLIAIRAAEPHWDLWVLLGEDGPFVGRLNRLGINVIVEPFPRSIAKLGDTGLNPRGCWELMKAALATLSYSRRLATVIRKLEPNVIHTNGFKMHFLGAWARPSGIPILWHIHDYVSNRPMMRRLLKMSRRRCWGAIANSKSVAADLGRVLPSLARTPVHNAVDLNRFSPDGTQADLDAAAGLEAAEPGTLRVGLVATFAKWKGHQKFLEALSLISPDLRFRGYVIGGPIYQTSGSQWTMAELKTKADQFGLGKRVGFTGFLEDTPAVMRALDVIVHASTSPEPFGMVIAEGMACGRAVIVSDDGGASELLENERTALAHSPGDAVGLAKQIERLLSDVALRRRLGIAARVAARQSFAPDRMARDVVQLYWECSPRTREAVEFAGVQDR
jgi:glycosyltransferase involved in cell wall biosynthesis